MLIFRGGGLAALLLALAGLTAVVPAARAQQPAGGITVDAEVTLTDQGLLTVHEKVQVPPGDRFRLALPLRVALSGGGERRFAVSGISTSGTAAAQVTGDLFTLTAEPGSAEFDYTVRGTVSDATGTQIFRWSGVLNTDVASITATVISPSYRMGIASCTIGPPGQPQSCADVRVEPDGTLHLHKENLHKGDAIDLTLQVPPGTVPANADYGDESRPFAITAPVLAAFGVLLAALLAFGGYLMWVRRQDAAALTGRDVLDPVRRDGDGAEFVSPDGVLPGQAGVLMSGGADAADLAATVVDLAVRRYLWIAPVSESDWRIDRVNAADDQLRPYEKRLYSTLLPEATESVSLSGLREPGRVDRAAIRSALRADVHERGILVDHTRRGPVFWLGALLAIAGIGTTVALAVAGGHALVGIAIALGGLAVALLPRLLPPRTAVGRELAGRVRALERGMDALTSEQVPAGARALVFSRALPYAIAGGRADNWIRSFRDADLVADREAGLYWFGGFDNEHTLQRFAGHFPYFITALEGMFATDGARR
jgi:hypothetical protein